MLVVACTKRKKWIFYARGFLQGFIITLFAARIRPSLYVTKALDTITKLTKRLRTGKEGLRRFFMLTI